MIKNYEEALQVREQDLDVQPPDHVLHVDGRGKSIKIPLNTGYQDRAVNIVLKQEDHPNGDIKTYIDDDGIEKPDLDDDGNKQVKQVTTYWLDGVKIKSGSQFAYNDKRYLKPDPDNPKSLTDDQYLECKMDMGTVKAQDLSVELQKWCMKVEALGKSNQVIVTKKYRDLLDQLGSALVGTTLEEFTKIKITKKEIKPLF